MSILQNRSPMFALPGFSAHRAEREIRNTRGKATEVTQAAVNKAVREGFSVAQTERALRSMGLDPAPFVAAAYPQE